MRTTAPRGLGASRAGSHDTARLGPGRRETPLAGKPVAFAFAGRPVTHSQAPVRPKSGDPESGSSQRESPAAGRTPRFSICPPRALVSAKYPEALHLPDRPIPNAAPTAISD